MIVSQYAITENYARRSSTVLKHSLQETHEISHFWGICHWWKMKCNLKGLCFSNHRKESQKENSNGIF